jgi:hypothetical protein
MKIVFGLHQIDKTELHSKFVYDMFYVSIQMANELGYETVLYGTSDAIERLGIYVTEVHNTNGLDYIFFDDLKIYILETRNDDYLIMDGDIFLHSPLIFKNTNSFLYVDNIVKTHHSGYMKDALTTFNSFDIQSIIPEWNPLTKISFSTGLLKIKGNNGLLNYYIQSYKKLRSWFLKNENELIKNNLDLESKKSLSSHIICEHLLQRVVEYYGLQFEQLDIENSYYHWQGSEKFKNNDKVNCITLLSDNHRVMNTSIKNVYNYLLNTNQIKPILYP